MTPPRALIAVLALLPIVGCGGGGGSTPTPVPVPTPAAITLPDLSVYLAQAHCADGSPPLGCANPVPTDASWPLAWRRFDNQDQISDSVVNSARGFYETTWAYGQGPFNAARGDGGEVYTSDGTTVSIVATQDGSQPGIGRFTGWALFDNTTVPCSQGWTPISQGRACRATVTYPASGSGLSQIVADSIVSEHYSGPNYTGDMERFYMAAGWGRLCWLAVPAAAHAPRPGMAASCGTGDPPLSGTAADRRLTTNLIAETPPLASVVDFGWPPPGWTP